MPDAPKDPPAAPSEPEAKPQESFYDAKFSIEALQHEPYESGFTWRTVIGAFFIAFVMLPGIIFMGLMIGQDMGTAADWVTIILFVELARRSFMTLRKQELYILKYTVSHLSHISGGVALGGGVFAFLVYNGYLRNSEAFHSFGIAYQTPDWFAPLGDLAYQTFTSPVWWPVIWVTVLSMVLSKLTQLSLGFLAYKITSDFEKLPFPLAPIHAEGAIALAESSQDKGDGKKTFRQYCFSVGVIAGGVFGLLYVAVPVLSQTFIGRSIQLLPIPFLDLTTQFERWLPAGTIGISLNLGLLLTGFVLPWRIVIGMFTTTMLFQIVLNPVFQRMGLLPGWAPGKGAIETQVSNTLDLYLSVGIGTALAVFLLGVYGIVKAVVSYRRKTAAAGGVQLDPSNIWKRDRERGDPPFWVPVVVWIAASTGYIFLCDRLINAGVPDGQRFSIWWLVSFAFFWTPINTYINARLSGIAGQHTGVPFVTEGAIFLSKFKSVSIWFAPLPIANYGGMADLLRETQLTRTRFTSLLKAELLIFPMLLIASFIFWSYITGLGPIPSDSYPYVQKFWPQFAQLKAVWASSMQEGDSVLFQALKPGVILAALAGVLALFGVFSSLGISAQYIYGGIGAMNGFPHMAVMVFAGALLGRFVLRKKFGVEQWTSYAPILAVGFGAGMGLIGMLAIAINFLWTSIGINY